MSREAVDQSYVEEWEKQFGVKAQDPEPDEPEIEEDEVEEQEDPTPEPEAPREEPAPKPQKQNEGGDEKPKSKDDEYREFIDSQPSEELKEKARKIVQGLKSADGRTSSLHRQLRSKELLINQLYNQRPKPQTEQPAPTSSRQEPAQSQVAELPEKVKALKQKNPAAAEIIEEIAKFHSNASMKQMQEMIDSRLGNIEQERSTNAKVAEWNRLEDRAAELFEKDGLSAADVIRSEDFRAWLELKKYEEPGIYKLYTQAKDADTAFLVLQKYEADYQAALANLPSEEREEITQSSKGDEIRQKREATRKQSTAMKPDRVATKSTNTSNLSYEEEWNMLYGPNGKYTKQNRRR